MMFTLKPTSKLVYLPLILLISHSFLINSTASEDSDDIEDLIAIDEEEYKQSSPKVEVLSKAQRIVLELYNYNTQRAIDENEYVMVLGYAPGEFISAALMPRFAEAACSLNELKSPVLMAKLDAELYPKAAWDLGIKGYPTLLLFVNGTSQQYTGGFLSEEIVTFVRKKTGTPVIRINSIDEANNILQKHSMFAVGLFDKFEGPNYEEFVKAAATDNEVQFVETSNSQIANILFPDANSSTSSRQFLGIVKSEPERYTIYENAFEKDKILQFLNDNKFPLVTFLTELNSVRVHASDKLQVYVYAKVDNFKKLLEPFQDAARKLKSQIMFLFVDIKDENLAEPYLPLFGREDSEDSLVVAFDNKTGAKYLLEPDLTPARIEEFGWGLIKGLLPPFYKSQTIPDNKDADVLTIVGKTFDDLVLRSSKNIILEIHTSWCLTVICETTSKQVEKLAKHFKGLESLVFAKIDASLNEHPKLEVLEFPTLLFYLVSNKSNPIKLPTKSSSKENAFEKDKILQFLNDNKFPLVTFLTELNSVRVHASNKLQVYVYAKEDNFKKLLEPFQDAARKLKSKIMFVFVDIKDENLAEPYLPLFGREDSEDTLVVAFDNKTGAKYLLEPDLTPARIEKDANILTIVGKTFDELVLRSSKNIILEIHTPWCVNCETTSKQVEKLAKHFNGLRTLVFAKIDAYLNEHPKLEINYPTLLFYPVSNKSNPIKLPTKSSSKNLAILINKYLKEQAHDEKHVAKDEF